MFNSALSAKYHAREVCFKVWYFRTNIRNKGDLACPMQPGATCATTNIEHKISRNGVGKMFLSTWCSCWLFYSLLPMFLDSEESYLEMKCGALSSWSRHQKWDRAWAQGCLSFRKGLAAVEQLSLVYFCYHCYFAAEWSNLHLGRTFSGMRTAQESTLDQKAILSLSLEPWLQGVCPFLFLGPCRQGSSCKVSWPCLL